jgi:hypothetical protein
MYALIWHWLTEMGRIKVIENAFVHDGLTIACLRRVM